MDITKGMFDEENAKALAEVHVEFDEASIPVKAYVTKAEEANKVAE